MNDKIKPAVIGGVVLGLLSVIPIINLGNVCCCLWAILGGVLASHLYIKSSPTPVSVGDGALLGAIAGLIGGAIYVVIGLPIQLLVGTAVANVLLNFVAQYNPGQVEMMRQQMMASQTVAGAIVRTILGAIILAIFSTLGGLIAVTIFEKRKGAPPPPPSYGT
ncbi:MAG: hypothetical protein C5B55_09025 [Blastocatellia bacterium]|nr:MAG: hypothetical protein C5B55_09025 [Blastocatellia bacterium]